MTRIENNLCVYDPRSDVYGDMYEDNMPAPRTAGCLCDRCFYGRDPLATRILRLLDTIDTLQMHALRDVTPGWVSVPEVEWDAALAAKGE